MVLMSEVATIPHTVGPERLRGQTRYSRTGRGDTVILLHGLGMQHSIWKPQVELLKSSYDVLTFDMLGHGESGLPRESPSLSDYSDQLLSVMDALGITRAHIAGHSMGALISLEFALAHPDRVRSVASLNGVYCRTEDLRRAVEHRAQQLDENGGITDPGETLTRWFGNPIPAHLSEAAEAVRTMLLSINPVGYRRTYRLFAGSDRRHHGRLAALAAPALFMTSENDAHSTPEMSEAMAAAAPDGRRVIIPHERHMMTITAPALVTQYLTAFFREVDNSASSIDRMTTEGVR